MKEKASDLTKALCLRILAKSFLTAYALCTAFHAPLAPGQYETFIDYAIASIYEILGEYDLRFFLLLLLAVVFYRFAHRRLEGTEQDGRSSALLAGFFALCLLFGQSYHLAADSSYILGSPVNLLKSALSFGGYAGLFRALIGLVWQAMDSHGFTGGGEHFFSRHAFSRSFLILAGAYLPFLLLAFPGNLCWDAIGQIEQVMGSAGYSTHHPLFHTLIMGGLVKAGQTLFHSPEIGLFVYMLLQDGGGAGGYDRGPLPPRRVLPPPAYTAGAVLRHAGVFQHGLHRREGRALRGLHGPLLPVAGPAPGGAPAHP